MQHAVACIIKKKANAEAEKAFLLLINLAIYFLTMSFTSASDNLNKQMRLNLPAT
jgi:hypothetical protein